MFRRRATPRPSRAARARPPRPRAPSGGCTCAAGVRAGAPPCTRRARRPARARRSPPRTRAAALRRPARPAPGAPPRAGGPAGGGPAGGRDEQEPAGEEREVVRPMAAGAAVEVEERDAAVVAGEDVGGVEVAV